MAAPESLPAPGFPALVELRAVAGLRLALRYSDGVEGTLAFDEVAASGPVFDAVREKAEFERVFLSDDGHVAWPSGLDLCADSLYLRLRKVTADEFLRTAPLPVRDA